MSTPRTAAASTAGFHPSTDRPGARDESELLVAPVGGVSDLPRRDSPQFATRSRQQLTDQETGVSSTIAIGRFVIFWYAE